MKSFRVVMINAAVRAPVVDVVQAMDREHALNFVLHRHNVRIQDFKIVMVEPYDIVAPSEFNHSQNNCVFDDENKLVAYEEKNHGSNHVIEFEMDGVIHHIDLGVHTDMIVAMMQEAAKEMDDKL